MEIQIKDQKARNRERKSKGDFEYIKAQIAKDIKVNKRLSEIDFSSLLKEVINIYLAKADHGMYNKGMLRNIALFCVRGLEKHVKIETEKKVDFKGLENIGITMEDLAQTMAETRDYTELGKVSDYLRELSTSADFKESGGIIFLPYFREAVAQILIYD